MFTTRISLPLYGRGNMKCVFKLLLPESFQQRNWQVFWLAPSSMPSHSHRTVAWRFEDTSELTAAVSAQDFHLIPFSHIAPRIEETSTKIEGKYTEVFLISKQIFNKITEMIEIDRLPSKCLNKTY